MIKKIFIVLIIFLCFGLWWRYYLHKQDLLGQQLVADAYNGDLLSVKQDIEAGAPLSYELDFSDEVRGYTGTTFNALQAAASSGNEDLITYLIKEQNFNINYATDRGWTPLFIAARDGQAEAAKLLVFYQADLNAQTDLGATALLMVLTQPFETEQVRQDLLKYMLKRGADVNRLTAENHSPLYYTLLEEKPELTEMMCRFGARLTEEEKQALGLTREVRTECGL